jgi:tRNA threonylcarbamoyladenosine modification (KEOPS) complex  Pcc1 subunit
MEIECELVFEYDTHEEAVSIMKAVELDNEGFLDTRIEDNKVISRVKANNLSSLQHTLDDYLACLSVAEKVISSRKTE